MFLERLVNQAGSPVLEQMLNFTAARHKLILENLANVGAQGYRQKDLDLKKFQAMLRDRVENRDQAGSGSTGFEDITAAVEHPTNGLLFHDGTNISMEQLEGDMAKNGMMHNMVIELLRNQYAQMDMALKERVG